MVQIPILAPLQSQGAPLESGKDWRSRALFFACFNGAGYLLNPDPIEYTC